MDFNIDNYSQSCGRSSVDIHHKLDLDEVLKELEPRYVFIAKWKE